MQFTKGDPVEIIKPDPNNNNNNNVAYYVATVLRSPAKHKNLVFIEYRHQTATSESDGCNHIIKEYVDLNIVRPTPPRQLNHFFVVGDNVDAYFERECVWRRGVVRDILENSKYVVGIHGKGEDVEFEQWNLRVHREWDDGSWVPPLTQQNKRSEMEVKPIKLRFKIKHSHRTLEEQFKKGSIVEVSSDEEGYKGSWYSAIVVDSIGNDKLLVEYLTLKTEDESKLLREETKVQYIRPFPPQLSPIACFKPLEQVDAWYNEGWWVGVISRVLNGFKYIIYFRSTNEELEFEHSALRPHQDWINGRWVIASKEKPSELEFKSKQVKLKRVGYERKLKPEFSKGMKVEVKSDEVGYEGSWYSAVIVNVMENDKYLVEYVTLKTDDESEFLREEANASDIRPSPPCIQRVYPYELLEHVDAWYNDGWWVGQIFKAFNGLKYSVYFRSTGEELEFDHCNLRPHQEWIDGKWFAASKDWKL